MTEEHKKHEHHVHHKKKKNYDKWKISTLVLSAVLIICVGLLAYGFSTGFQNVEISKEKAGEKAIPFINNFLLQGQAVAKLEEVNNKEQVYSVKSNINGNEIKSYVSTDGNFICPQAIDLNEFEKQVESLKEQEDNQQPETNLKKSDKPNVELFVMSHCPYGTQAEKGIIPAVETLGDNIDFEIKFVHYAMHNDEEVQEQIRQYCIKENYPEEYMEYLKCFLNEGKHEKCVNNIDEEVIAECVEETDNKYNISENYPNFPLNAEDSQKYGVKGSPALIINGESVNSARNPQAYLETICSAFNEQPEVCNEKISTQTYSPGFGYEAGSDTTATC